MTNHATLFRERIEANLNKLQNECTLVDMIYEELVSILTNPNYNSIIIGEWYYHHKYSIATIETKLSLIENS